MAKLFGAIAATCLLGSAGALAAAPGGDSAPKPVSDETAKKEKKVCKTEKMTGSLTRVRRICMTRSEWAEMAEGTNRTLDRLGRSANHAEAMTTRSAGGRDGHGHEF